MKNGIFVDTVAWLALVNKSEDLHDAACVVRDQLIQQKAKLFTSDFIVVEIANSLARLPLRGVALKLIDFIRTSNTVELVTITPELFEKAYQLYCSRDDKELGGVLGGNTVVLSWRRYGGYTLRRICECKI